jgi:hypothetical protein
MSGDDPTFRWDDKGISAYDHDRDSNGIISNVNTKTFVRFDKYGLYGIKEVGVDGEFFVPEKIEDIEGKSTFALTWEGLKVTGNNNVVAKFGKQDDSILVVNDGEEDTFKIDNDGNVSITGTIYATAGEIGGVTIKKIEDTLSSDLVSHVEIQYALSSSSE